MLVPAAVVPALSQLALLVADIDPTTLAADLCLARGYHGTYGAQSIFIADDDCYLSASDSLSAGSILPIPAHGQLVWLEHEAVDDAIRPTSFVDELDAFLEQLASPAHPAYSGYAQQEVLVRERATPELLHRTATSALVAVDTEDVAYALADHLPRFWKSTPVPSSPIPLTPVSAAARARLSNLLSSVKFDPIIASVVNNISATYLQLDVTYLSGEDPSSPIISRNAFTEGALIAADWLKTRVEETGASCELKPFREGWAPNVICSYPATVNTTETVLISAHYDSRGSFGSTRAPGADDDGSGTVAILGIARTIARKNISFRKNVQLCLFSGEEQGLVGSRAYAREMRAAGADLTLMIQADMLAYHAPGEPQQLGLPERIGSPEVSQFVANLSAIYSPELTVGTSPACCSDHQSFWTEGFPATQVFERAGPIADPMYHNDGDLSDREGYDFDQVKSIAKVQFAAILHAAGFDINDE
ncbi:hypothetical protein CERSUDRAFT_154934 [Gelatoporia subvermispora B]|uniref:Peptide hydrolase n=1 Tax=Ceriporiopsis subvermispora (strain B) TaxID=914234 RepID=M2QWX3_CERS8|nr:hypothetical protein CERSUDRAFT_154934 [Gelatoporia subvermispora B]